MKTTRALPFVLPGTGVLVWYLTMMGTEVAGLFSWASSNRTRNEVANGGLIDPEATMTTIQIIQKNKYPAEEYTVQTDDGYILGLHRIPNARGHSGSSGVPVLVMHGLLCSSAVWVDNTINISLGYLLADAGYDVWLGNVRGNTYSRRHVKLSPSDKEFWSFSWTEHALHDLPAMIDFVLHKTRYRRLLYVGHSMGTTMMLALLATKNEYNQKVKGIIALAPVALVRNVKGPVRTMATNAETIKFTLSLLGQYELLPNSFVTRLMANMFCRDGGYQQSCDNLIFQFAGYDPGQLNQTRLPIYMSHCPAGTSLKNIYHFGQMVTSKQFVPFDYGSPEKNMKKYGKPNPPPYDLSKVTTQVALFWGENDLLADPADVAWLAKKLPNLVLNYKVPYRLFTHVDFMWGKDSRRLLYYKVMETLGQMWRVGELQFV